MFVIFSVFLYWFEVYSIDASMTIGKFHEVLNFNYTKKDVLVFDYI